ncbi:MAG: pentapeptide repeat-containing protein [Cyanobacteria bacterium P01_A01_bin.68]
MGDEYANLVGANFEKAKFIETLFAGENTIDGCNFSYANFSHAQGIQNLFGVEEITEGVNFSYANFSYTDFNWFEFARWKLNLVGAIFNLCNLRQANLSNLDLSNTRFIRADLQGANLANSNLINADLSGANLKGANLTGVNFQKIGRCKNIQIDLNTKIDEEWRSLVDQETFIPNLEDITQQLQTLQNKPTWQLVCANYARGEEFPINEHYNNQQILINKITQGYSLKILISFIGESQQLSLSPQTTWIEPKSLQIMTQLFSLKIEELSQPIAFRDRSIYRQKNTIKV